MEQITMYKAKDGEIFETLEECREHEEAVYPSADSLKDLCLWDLDMRPLVLDGNRSYAELYDGMRWIGSKVIFQSDDMHRHNPRYYPPVGTIGTIVALPCDSTIAIIQWPDGTTSNQDQWACDLSDITLV